MNSLERMRAALDRLHELGTDCDCPVMRSQDRCGWCVERDQARQGIVAELREFPTPLHLAEAGVRSLEASRELVAARDVLEANDGDQRAHIRYDFAWMKNEQAHNALWRFIREMEKKP